MGRVQDKHRNLIGCYDKNPVLDSRFYNVMFPDGIINQYAANIITESNYNEVDEDGLLDAVSDIDAFIITRSGTKKGPLTAKG